MSLELRGWGFRQAQRRSARGKRLTGPATKQRIKATIRTVLAAAQREHLVTFNAAALVALKPAPRPKGVRLDEGTRRSLQRGVLTAPNGTLMARRSARHLVFPTRRAHPARLIIPSAVDPPEGEAGQGHGDKAERPAGRTTWAPWPWPARLVPGRWRAG
ncbi:hypothetical protein GCM10022224_034680 [Nonomuraea antimicrobica]|uniref:Uncharacterized protein n=1 Tax=Nonomuraea antimicrobica TaxID=561173 RepID=A0ABP7BR41_9ACTN